MTWKNLQICNPFAVDFPDSGVNHRLPSQCAPAHSISLRASCRHTMDVVCTALHAPHHKPHHRFPHGRCASAGSSNRASTTGPRLNTKQPPSAATAGGDSDRRSHDLQLVCRGGQTVAVSSELLTASTRSPAIEEVIAKLRQEQHMELNVDDNSTTWEVVHDILQVCHIA